MFLYTHKYTPNYNIHRIENVTVNLSRYVTVSEHISM